MDRKAIPRVKHRRALFVSGIDGFCHRYAVLHRASHLRSCGWQVSVLPYQHRGLLDAAGRADLLFFYRVPANARVLRVLQEAALAGRRRIGLVDDLIFRREQDQIPPFVLGEQARGLWQEGADRYAEVLHACDEVLAGSEELVEEVRKMGMAGHLYRDALASEELALAQAAHNARSVPRHEEDFRVGYFSGTATHASDFAQLAAGLAAAMREDTRISLRIHGPLSIPSELAGLESRIDQKPLIPWVELPAAIAAVDLNLAPLDTDSRFSVAKGATKVMEAAACGVPSIGSFTSSHRAAMVPQGGWLVDGPEDWHRGIVAAAQARASLAEVGCRAQAHIVEHYGPAARVGAMKQLLERAEGAAPARAARSGDPAPRADLPADRASGSRWEAFSEPESEVAFAPDAFPTLPERSWTDISPPLGEGDLLRQKFSVTKPGLFRLDFFTLTYGQSFDHSIGVRLQDAAGAICAQASWEAGRLPDRAFFAWEFEESLAAGEYGLELEARGTGPGNAASFGLVAAGAERSPATMNGEEIAGALGLRGFSSWDQVF
jgi:hypothetical protein